MVSEGGVMEWIKLEFCCWDVTRIIESLFSFLSAGNNKTYITEFLGRVYAVDIAVLVNHISGVCQ